VKVQKGSESQARYDESKFTQPLADLGIEFSAPKPISGQAPRASLNSVRRDPKEGVFSSVKKVFSKKPPQVERGNSALKAVLNKISAPNPTPPPSVVPKAPEPVSLDSLKDKIKEINKTPAPSPSRDRAASTEDMNKLKDLISTKTETKKEPTQNVDVDQTSADQNKKREVPEDVLRKILE
ncbi:MAG: hypothetical protein ACREGC_03240, partial [Minisyncoccia bacterium]